MQIMMRKNPLTKLILISKIRLCRNIIFIGNISFLVDFLLNMGCGNTKVINKQGNGPKKKLSHKSSVLLDRISKVADFKTKFDYISELGSGGFGKVRLFRDKNIPEMKYAIKTLKKNFLNIHAIDSIIREVSIVMQLDHPNIVKYFETFEDEHYIHLVMEFIPGENLFCLLWNSKRKITESDMNSISKYLLKAVGFLHNNDIVHRDIKPENILFSIPGKITLYYFIRKMVEPKAY